jgi:hypothetical protein
MKKDYWFLVSSILDKAIDAQVSDATNSVIHFNFSGIGQPKLPIQTHPS